MDDGWLSQAPKGALATWERRDAPAAPNVTSPEPARSHMACRRASLSHRLQKENYFKKKDILFKYFFNPEDKSFL